MENDRDINRFLKAQDSSYDGYNQALAEITNGYKSSHWIWYIFPQLKSLGRSYNATYYGIADENEAREYLANPILNQRLQEITEVLLTHSDKSPTAILGGIDAKKVRSCMTLFDFISPNDIFAKVLDTFYNGNRCQLTLRELKH